jgi:adenylosuccinate synthase
VGIAGRHGAVVLLSGPVGAGKTTLAEELVGKLGFKRLFTRDAILRRLPETPRTRVDLQAAGERLDRETGGRWVADEVRDQLDAEQKVGGIVVDAVLIQQQVDAVRAGTTPPVFHVHLTAPASVLESRYAIKEGGIEEALRYSEVRRSKTEARVGDLAQLADLVIDTSVTPLSDEMKLVIEQLEGLGGDANGGR